MKLNEKKVPAKLDLIVSNPPWLIAKKNRYES
jgi:methylase of polypeptide subunit release factors